MFMLAIWLFSDFRKRGGASDGLGASKIVRKYFPIDEYLILYPHRWRSRSFPLSFWLFEMLRCTTFVVLLALATNVRGDEDAYFESRVRPLLIEHCYECHSGTSTKGGLSLESSQGWQKGGDSGAAILPGKPGESLVIQAIRYSDENMQMPPKGKLSAEAIEVLEEWVRSGAHDPRVGEEKLAGMKLEDAKSWWSFQPVSIGANTATSSGVSSNSNSEGTSTIDRMVAAKLRDAGVQAFPQADPRDLIRRMSYDLLGLPPSPEDVDAFLLGWSQCHGPEQRQVHLSSWIDRYLESPQYGVHWGRHWLDVVRYADTAGENTDRPLVHAWRYRNWVFDAWNRDMPYADFIRLQIAGDLVASDSLDDSLADGATREASVRDLQIASRAEGIIATGYLAIARRFGHDIDKDMHLTYEDVIDNIGRAFLGLSIGCARCHDHKYDPVTAEDYYALYGVFESCRFSFPGCEPKGQPKDMIPLATQEEIDRLLKPYQEKKERLERAAQEQEKQAQVHRMRFSEAISAQSELLAESQVDEGASVPFGAVLSIKRGDVLMLSVSPNGNYGADTTRVEWSIAEDSQSPRTWNVSELIPDLLSANPHPGSHGAHWCFLETTSNRFLVDRKPSIQGNLSLQGWESETPPSVFVNTADQPVSVWTSLSARSLFVHPGVDRKVGIAWVSPIDGQIKVDGRITDEHRSGGDGVFFQVQRFSAPEVGDVLLQLGASSEPQEKLEAMPSIDVAYGVVEAQSKNARLHLRGDPEKLGNEIPRRWLTVFGSEPIGGESASGRIEIAQRIATSPLAARVIVNRVWQWHFGRGLVRTPNEFGSRGELPTHPELLEYLTEQFIAHGYSIKHLHRLIMQSEAYRRASGVAGEVDPENRWLGCFSRRRLTAEEMRDSLLLVGGNLDLSFAKQHPFPSEGSWTFTQHDPFSAVYQTDHRTAFMMVQRQRRHPFLATFDGADPNGTTPIRESTTVPTQALYFMNDPFFHAQAGRLAARMLSEENVLEKRIDLLWRVLFQRKATPNEELRVAEFLERYPGGESDRWSACVRALLASNEFMVVD
jgi:hypothetical protein